MEKKSRNNVAVSHPQRSTSVPVAPLRVPGALKRKPGDSGKGSRGDGSGGNNGNSVGRAGAKPGARPGKQRLILMDGGKAAPDSSKQGIKLFC